MIPRTLWRLFLFIVKLTIFLTLFIDIVNHKLYDMGGSDMHLPPTEEEQQARLDHWTDELVGKYLVDERGDGAAGEDRVNAVGEAKADGEKPWLYRTDGKDLVMASKIPGSVRPLWPGTPMTRDLRLNRLNIFCEKDGKVTKVSFC
ncbi:hypothetical protein GGF46_004262 [Coemansia sp. RSA 552]|nr:hypothetical protein GGF46_004262 [Coemansia sp. RSA 552]